MHYFHHLAELYCSGISDPAQAVRWAKCDLELRENYSTLEMMARALYSARRLAEAVTMAERALAFGIQDAHLFHHVGMIYMAAGRDDEGEALLERSAAINPRCGSFHIHR